ncbi:MAG TPA: hypothetical protein VGF17_06240 [Phytomonospora sp.]
MALNRRDTLRLFGAGAVAITGAPALIGCSSDGNSGDVGNEGKELAPYPTYVPLVGPTPDLPGDDKGVQNAYLNYPTDIKPAGFDTPGDGSAVTASVITYGVPPTAADQNKFRQAINAALGIQLELQVIPAANFKEKMATMMAGNELPDIMMFGAGEVLPREEQFIASACADISEHISGDAVKTYPGLANIPAYAWQGLGRIGGRLYGVPIERPIFGGSLMLNRTLVEKAGAKPDWDKDGFLAAMKGVTGGKRYGLGIAMAPSIDYYAGGLGAPNVWEVGADGKFATAFGTQQYKDTLVMLQQMFKDGTVYPDGASTSGTDMKTVFNNQTVAAYRDGWGGYSTQVLATAKDKWTLDFGLPFAGGNSWGGTGRFGYTVFKKADPARIKMLLAVTNFLAAPFGTKEFELFNYGVEGTHFTRDDKGTPVPTDLWTNTENSTNFPVKYLGSAPLVLHYSGFPDATERVYEWEKKVAPITVPDPSNGIRSQAWTENGAALQKSLTDAWMGIIFRGEDISTYDAVLTKWHNDGGQKAAEEFAAEYAASK